MDSIANKFRHVLPWSMGRPSLGSLRPSRRLAIGTFPHIFGLIITSLATEYYHFILAYGICCPIGMYMIFNPAMTTVITWFAKKRSLAFCIVASGSSLGTRRSSLSHASRQLNFCFQVWRATMEDCSFLTDIHSPSTTPCISQYHLPQEAPPTALPAPSSSATP